MYRYTIPLKKRPTRESAHDLVMTLMSRSSDDVRDFTFHVNDKDILIQTDRIVDLEVDHTRSEISVSAGDKIVFASTFSPFRGHNSNIPIVRDVEITEWLAGVGARNGLAVLRSNVLDKKHVTFPYKGRTLHVNHVSAIFYSEIVDEEKANNFFKIGLGKHRGFGYGMVDTFTSL